MVRPKVMKQVMVGDSQPVTDLLADVRLWLRRGFWAVADQALFAGSNFLVGVLLARWLEPAAYGAYTTAYAVFLLLGTFHTALWTEPLVVFGSGRFADRFPTYQRIVLAHHWYFGALVATLFVALGLGFRVLGRAELGLSFLGLAVAAPFTLYLWLVRRSAYTLLRPQLAVSGGVLYLLVFLGASLVLRGRGWLNEGSALLLMGLSGFAAGYLVRWLLQGRAHKAVPTNPAEVRALHWEYGRWALVAGGLSWVHGNVYFMALPAFHGLESAARLRVLLNLVMPVLHFNSAVGELFVPVFVRARHQGKLLSRVVSALRVQMVPALAFWLFLLVGGGPLMGWLYGGKYESTGLAWLGLLGITAAVASPFGAVLRAVERPDQVARISAVTALVSLTVGVGLVYVVGLDGALAGIVGINAVAASLFAVVGIRWGKTACA